MPDSETRLRIRLLSPSGLGGQTPELHRPGFVPGQRVYRKPSGPHSHRLSGAQTGLRTQGLRSLGRHTQRLLPSVALLSKLGQLVWLWPPLRRVPEVSLALRGHLKGGPHARIVAGVSGPLETSPRTKTDPDSARQNSSRLPLGGAAAVYRQPKTLLDPRRHPLRGNLSHR